MTNMTTRMKPSMDNASQAARSVLEELVPSRYALQVGELEVMVISDGVLPLPAATLATNADPVALKAWLAEGLLGEEYTWPLNAAVVKSGKQTVLIDAGLGDAFPQFRAGRLAQRLKGAGIDLASVTDVVLTHLHMDHVGGLLADGFKGGLRPDVPIHVAAAELDFWAAPDFSRNTFGGVSDAIRAAAKQFLDEYRGRLRLFETEREVAPGVVALRTGGHTPGHSVVRLASGSERLTFLGDAVFPDHFDRPDWHNAFDHDPEEAVRVRIALLRKLAATREPVLAAHLPFPSLGRVALAGDAFRWVPTIWDY